FMYPLTGNYLHEATEKHSSGETAVRYERFVQAREAAIIEEIRSVCGIEAIEANAAVEPDEAAADIRADSWTGDLPPVTAQHNAVPVPEPPTGALGYQQTGRLVPKP